MFVPNDPLYSEQWNFPAIDMEHAWDLNPGATSSIVVAVLDSGVAYRNAVLRRDIPSWRDVFGSSVVTYPALGHVDIPFAAAPDLGAQSLRGAARFIWNDTDPLDLDGHGTHVAGTIGEATNNGIGVAGMAFNVRIMPVKVIDSIWDDILGSPFEGTDDVVARGVRYAVDNGAKVLNMSFGRSGAPSPLLQDAIIYATSHGALYRSRRETISNAATRRSGLRRTQLDTGCGGGWRDRSRSATRLLLVHGTVCRAGRTGREPADRGNDRGYRPANLRLRLRRYVRQRAGTLRTAAVRHLLVSIPAGNIDVHAARRGFAALLMQQGITSPAAVEAAMEQFATDLGRRESDQQYGYGLINPRASLRGLGLSK
jgi:serine protease